jgi:anti-sigma factor RsiW
MLLRRRTDLVCQQVVELVTDYLEGGLSRSDRRRFKDHLRTCPDCTNYLEQMRATIVATGALQVSDLSPDARREYTDLFRQWWREGGQGPAAQRT